MMVTDIVFFFQSEIKKQINTEQKNITKAHLALEVSGRLESRLRIRSIMRAIIITRTVRRTNSHTCIGINKYIKCQEHL